MQPTFAMVREHIIDALYLYLHEDHPNDAQQGYLQPEQIAKLVNLSVSGHFFGMVINALRDEGVIEPYSSFWMFRLSRAGVGEAERRAEKKLSDLVPASDRIVSRSDNIQIAALSSGVNDLVVTLQTSNEAGAILGEDRETAVGELEASVVIASKTRIRLAALAAILLPALRFISEKFASGAIGDAAKRLIELLLKIL